MVTFEIFARAALELLGGQQETALYMPWARLTREFRATLRRKLRAPCWTARSPAWAN